MSQTTTNKVFIKQDGNCLKIKFVGSSEEQAAKLYEALRAAFLELAISIEVDE